MASRLFHSAAAGLVPFLLIAAAAPAAQIKWVSSYPDAKRQAKDKNALMMLDFYTDWWGWCKRLERDTYIDGRVIELSEQFVPVKINAEENRSVATKYKVRGYPAIIFADGKGRVVGKIRGYMPPEPFAATMSQIARIHRELPAIQASYDANPQDLETAALLASAYATRGDVKRAKKFVKILEEADSQVGRDHLAQAYLALGDYYIDKENYRSAAKSYAKAAEIGKDLTQVADARLNLAYAYYSERLRFPPGSRPATARLKKAEDELVALMKIADLPEDRKTQAEQLLETVKKAAH